MHLGMQRLDAAVHHFGKAGEVSDLPHLEAGILDQLVGAAGRDQLDAGRGQSPGKVGHAGLVEYRKQRPPDLDRLAHEDLSPCGVNLRAR
ncbi:hypothetical protein D3C87_2019880 [compost metagenome]